MNEKQNGKHRKTAPNKPTRARNGHANIRQSDFRLLNVPRELRPHWIITPLLLVTAIVPLLPRTAAAPGVMNNTTGHAPLSPDSGSALSAVPLEAITPPLAPTELMHETLAFSLDSAVASQRRDSS